MLLGYSTNVHPGESLGEVVANLGRFAGPVARALGRPLGVGLWLSRRAAAEADGSPAALARLRDALARDDLVVFTLNAFPYGDFHAARVKETVFAPDWTARARLDYTLACARVLAGLLPPGVEGTISTLPLGPRGTPAEPAAAHLAEASRALARLREESGARVRLCLEPEPSAAIESTEELIGFFAGPLARAGAERDFLGACFDACHALVLFEDPAASLAALARAGVAVGKAQISNAVALRGADAAALPALDEPRFLHQVRARAGGAIAGALDIPAALAALPREGEWRVHFHAPVHRDAVGALATTRAELASALPAIARATAQLELETYTWTVLPAAARPRDDAALCDALAAELRWVEAHVA